MRKVLASLKKKFLEMYYIICIIFESITKKNKIYILGVPLHGNIGDQAILIAEEKFLHERFGKYKVIEVQTELIIKYKILSSIIGKSIIFYTGGGFLGTLWKNEEEMFRYTLENFKENKIVAMPQTFFFEENSIELEKSKEIYEKYNNLYIICRERFSFDFMKNNFKNIKLFLIPDMVLYLNPIDYGIKRDDILFCIRKDKEKCKYNFEFIKNILRKYNYKKYFYTDTVINKAVYKINRKKIVYKKIKEFAKYKLVITDRLHGMIFSYLAKTPCLVLENRSYKIKGVYKWIESCKYIKLTDEEHFEEDVRNIIQLDKCISCDISEKFEKLEEILKGVCNGKDCQIF